MYSEKSLLPKIYNKNKKKFTSVKDDNAVSAISPLNQENYYYI